LGEVTDEREKSRFPYLLKSANGLQLDVK